MSKKHSKILQIIRLITSEAIPKDDKILSENDSSYPIIVEIFTNGNCGNFALLLKTIMEEGTVSEYRSEHSATHYVYGLDGKYYDVTGDVTEIYAPIFHHPDVLDNRNVKLNLMDKHIHLDSYSYEERGPLF